MNRLRPTARRLVAGALALLTALIPAAAGAQSAPPSAAATNAIQIARLTAVPVVPATLGPSDSADGLIQFEAVVDYRLQTAARGALLVFVFEDDADTASQSGAQSVAILGGTGRQTLRTTYQPKTSVDAVTVLVGLFQEDRTLLTWSATTPLSLAPYPGRLAFTEATAARLSGNHAAAVGHLTEAIESGQPTSQYYYWRADSRVYLGDFTAAIQDYSRALDLAPKDRVSRVGRGIAYLWNQEWDAALADLTLAIQESTAQDRPLAWAHRARGLTHAALGQDAAAIADYRTYLTLIPTAPDRAEVEAWIAQLA